MKPHWTQRSIKDYLFKIGFDFIGQLEDKMESMGITQTKLAKRMGKSRSRISQVLNNPGNISLLNIIEYVRALGMKVSIVAYEDGDPENKKGPINPEIFKICWEHCGCPRDFWELKEAITTTANTMGCENAINIIDGRLLNPIFSRVVDSKEDFSGLFMGDISWKDETALTH